MSRKMSSDVKRKPKRPPSPVERVEVRGVGVKVQELRFATGRGVAQQGEEDLVDVGARGCVEQNGVVLVADFGLFVLGSSCSYLFHSYFFE